MIVASLLLILVAVLLLVLGLVGGSSSLLISSIVASLLAAVALVAGARQSAARRESDPDAGPSPARSRARTRSAARAAAGSSAAAPASEAPSADSSFAGPGSSASSFAGPGAFSDLGSSRERDAYADRDVPGAFSGSGDASEIDDAVPGPVADRDAPDDDRDDRARQDQAAAYAAGQRDAEAGLTGPPRTAATTGPDVTQRVIPDADLRDESPRAGAGAGGDHAPFSGPESSRTGAGPAHDAPGGEGDRPRADYEQAASVIGAARSEGDASPESAAGPPVASDPAEAGEYAAPDPEDPDDEPLPQAVRPADAVRVARMDAEVLVVDGRPRYHVAGCPHLAGRETEGLPVAEAVELGFSPCGQCRPVDRLVAAAARS
ncbi:hypothetical protein [Symbioplanes lichenis]|uniref:hypothetical protein n=1 Tax=Symbioplanes lichenis TaxID=1629072 RepID=UPI0027381F65|nr:hypothetical protein [Actinoplanes lichenis]